MYIVRDRQWGGGGWNARVHDNIGPTQLRRHWKSTENKRRSITRAAEGTSQCNDNNAYACTTSRSRRPTKTIVVIISYGVFFSFFLFFSAAIVKSANGRNMANNNNVVHTSPRTQYPHCAYYVITPPLRLSVTTYSPTRATTCLAGTRALPIARPSTNAPDEEKVEYYLFFDCSLSPPRHVSRHYGQYRHSHFTRRLAGGWADTVSMRSRTYRDFRTRLTRVTTENVTTVGRCPSSYHRRRHHHHPTARDDSGTPLPFRRPTPPATIAIRLFVVGRPHENSISFYDCKRICHTYRNNDHHLLRRRRQKQR